MLKYSIKRLLLMIPVILGVLIVVFTISYFMPGDPVDSMMPVNYTQEMYDAKAAELGLDRPYIVQLGDYLWGVVTRFDLGTSYTTNRPVLEMIGTRVWVTVKIGTLSILFTVVFAMLFGIISAVKQYSALDYGVTTLSIVMAAMPNFWVSLMFILLFSSVLQWLPASGLTTWKHYILPVVCNGLMPLAAVTRMTRSSMLEVIRQDYVRTARSKGLKEGAIVFRHCLKNALIPVITMVGNQFSNILGGSVVIETIFNIPGMGSLLVSYISQRDYPGIMGITFILSLFMCVIVLLVDIIFAVVDPRIRIQFAGNKNKKKRETPGTKVVNAA